MPIYRPLRVSQQEIRILVIKSSENSDDQLQCGLEYCALGTNPEYDALSYCWGNPSDQKTIYISGNQLRVTVNLARALRELRAKGIRRIWADAICINQDDLEERSQQVLNMSAIYRSASQVIAWLGYSLRRAPNSGTVANTALATAKQLLKARELVNKNRLEEMRLFLGRLSSHDWDAFIELISNQYWKRVWIIQELAMAVQLKIIWNGAEIPESVLSEAVHAYHDIREEVAAVTRKAETILPESSHIVQLWAFRSKQQSCSPVRLLRALEMSHRAESTDPRDKVFAILGLTYDGPTIVPTPSYALPSDEISRQATLKWVRVTKSLDILFLRNCPPESWAIDWFDSKTWSNDRIVSCLLGESQHRNIKDSQLTMSAPAAWKASENSRPPIQILGSRAIVRAHVVTAIHSCTSVAFWATSATPDQRSHFTERTRRREFMSQQYIEEALYFCLCEATNMEDPAEDLRYIFSRTFGHILRSNPLSEHLKAYERDILQWLRCSENGNLPLHNEGTLIELLAWKPRTFDVRRYKVRLPKVDPVKRAWDTLRLGWRLVITEAGHIGMVTPHAMPGDKIAFVHGCRFPVILRSVEGELVCQVVGDAIIYRPKGEGLGSMFYGERNIVLK